MDYIESKITIDNDNNNSFGWGKNFLFNFKKLFRDLNPIPAVYKSNKSIPSERNISKSQYNENNKKFTLGDKFIWFNIIANGILLNLNKNMKRNLTISNNNNWKAKTALAIAAPLAILFTLSSYAIPFIACKRAIEGSIDATKDCSAAHKHLIAIADLLKSLDKLKDLPINSLPENSSSSSTNTNTGNILVIKNINNCLSDIASTPDGKQLLDLLNSPTFADTNKKSAFYSRGNVLAADYLFKKIHKDFQPLLQNIACLGGYRAIATMIKESQNTNTKICFVEVVDSPTPVIDLKNAWYPLINSTIVVTSDIKLDPQAASAIITGPNGGGKSMTLKAAGFNGVASRLGIAFAESAKISNFARIVTSLQSKEDAQKSLSSFMSEHKNIESIKTAISKCDKNKHVLAILDEPYRGTYEAEAQERVYDIAKNITQDNKNCSLLIATHLKKPSELANDTNNLFKNYQMGSIEKGDQDFERTFKLQDGPASWWYDNTNNGRTRYVSWLIKNEIPD